MTPWQLRQAVKCIQQGGIIAYPTEAVFGLGCDPLDLDAVESICSLKHRSLEQGLILIVSRLDQARPYTTASDTQLKKLQKKTSRPITWLLPKSDLCPPWITGQYDSIAIRCTTHPIALQLCEYTGQALVSTSANISRHPPAQNARDVRRIFGNNINIILHDDTGNQTKPSEIRDLISGKKLR